MDRIVIKLVFYLMLRRLGLRKRYDADVNGDDSKVAFNSKFLQDVVGV
ncbi:MAG: hypothetical protein CM15mP91_0950 [Chloroflexota bacterium]|nr:MAG: hypothetical protein CM15mP91_0950 [Chloroflexota bacterium]